MTGPRGAQPLGLGVGDVWDVVRRRWLVVAFTVLVLLALSWWQLRRDVPHYTAQVLLQRHRMDILMIGGAPTIGAHQVLASELEIIRSRSVLDPVVAGLGLRLALENAKLGRSRVASAVEIEPAAPAASYVMAPRGDSVTLRTPGGAPITAVPRGATLAGPGFRMRPAPGLSDGPVRFVILSADEAARQLRAAVNVGQIEGTNLIRVRYTGTDPQLAAAVVNEIAAAYQRHSVNQDRADGARRREFIAEQLAGLADSMAAAQAALLDYQRQSRSLDPRLEGQAVASALLETQNEVRGMRFHESLLTAVLLLLRGDGSGSEAFRRLVALGSSVLPGAETLYNRLQTLETERQRLTASRYGYTDQGPQVQVLDSLIAATKVEARGITEEALDLLRTRRAAAETRQRELQQRVGELPEQAMTFARLQQRVDAVQRIVDLLVEKFYEALIPEAGGSGGVEVVDAATAPSGSDPLPGRSRILFGLVLGLALGTGLAFGLEYVDTTVRYPWDVEAAVQLPIVGIIPVLKTPSALAPEGNSAEAEAFRMVRTTLRFLRAERPRVIVLTSPGPGEGKSLIAVNLALAIQQQASRTLLIDADLRHPVVHRSLQLAKEPGLTDALVAEAALEDCLRSLPSGLSVLTAGTTAPNPAELLGSEAFTMLLAQLRERFDTVVIDTPPVLSVTDAATLAPVVDGILVVASVNQTHRLALAHAVEQLSMVKGAVLGVLLNRAPPTGAYRRYAYPYGAYTGRDNTPLGQLRHLLRGGRRSG